MAVHGYPEPDKVGDQGHWRFTVGSTEHAFAGTLLAVATTRQAVHSHEGPYTDGRPCTACRWFEVAVFALEQERYALHTAGMSDMPGEDDRGKFREARDATEAVFLLSSPGSGGTRFLSKPIQEALERAGAHDEPLRGALNRFLADPGVVRRP